MVFSIRREIFPYAIVVFFGYVGFSLPLPILPELFLDPARSILPETFSIEKKTFLLGALMSCYPLGQLFGAPLLGRLSDRFGRKKIILISLCGTTIGYLITALATSFIYVPGIFLGLLVCGFSEGNIAIAQSVISDLTQKEHIHDRASHFGWMNFFVNLGFIVGPFLGGQLADPEAISWFNFSTPFWAASIMTISGIFIILLASKETKNFSKQEKRQKFFGDQTLLLRAPKLRKLYMANFFLALGFFSFFRFFPVYLERVYDFSSSQLAYVMVYNSIAFALSLIWFVPPLSRNLQSKNVVAIFSLLLGLSFILCLLPSSSYALIFTIPPVGFVLAVCITNGSLIVSHAVDNEMQGQAMGTLTSVQVSAEFLISIGGGFLAANLPSLPLLIGALMSAICFFILLGVKKQVI